MINIEDSFVNSQEWTISRQVHEIRIAVIGGLRSGKSALVHRYLTGSYVNDESPEGGRFKKEVNIEGNYSGVRIITSLLKQTPGFRYRFPAVLICFEDFKITAQGCDFFLLWGLLKKVEKNTVLDQLQTHY